MSFLYSVSYLKIINAPNNISIEKKSIPQAVKKESAFKIKPGVFKRYYTGEIMNL